MWQRHSTSDCSQQRIRPRYIRGILLTTVITSLLDRIARDENLSEKERKQKLKIGRIIIVIITITFCKFNFTCKFHEQLNNTKISAC